MLLDLLPSILLISSLISSYVNFEISWEEFRSFRGRFGLFDVALYCRASSRNVQIASHEVSKCTEKERTHDPNIHEEQRRDADQCLHG